MENDGTLLSATLSTTYLSPVERGRPNRSRYTLQNLDLLHRVTSQAEDVAKRRSLNNRELISRGRCSCSLKVKPFRRLP